MAGEVAREKPPVAGECGAAGHVKTRDVAGERVVAEFLGERYRLVPFVRIEVSAAGEQGERVHRVENIEGNGVEAAVPAVAGGEQLVDHTGRAPPGVDPGGVEAGGQVIDD